MSSQARNGSQHGAKHLSLQDRQRGDGSQSIDGFHGNDLAFHEAALDLELAIELLCEFSNDTGGSHGIAGADGQRRGAVELIIQLVQTAVVECKAQQGVLDDGVLDVVFTALGTQRGILCHGDALVIHKDAGSRVLHLLGQSRHDRLLFRQYFCVGHSSCSPP